MDFLIPFIFLACVILAVSFILWSLGSIQALQERTRKIEAKQVTARNTLNQFMSKLATVDETFEAMDILVSSFWEDINCESIGIFVLDDSSDSGDVLKGAACTAMFPIFDPREEKAYSSAIDNSALEEKVFENPRYRTAHFKSEKVFSGKGLLGEVIKTRKPMIIDKRDEQSKTAAQPHSVWTMMAIPLTFEGKFIGIMVAVNRRDGIRAFSDLDMEEFQRLAIQAEFSANLILVYKERQKQDRIVQELASYAKMQQTLMPDIPKKKNDYRFAPYQAPAMEVSGDFFDYEVLEDDHRVLLIVADATGKGLPACLMTSMCYSFVRCLKERFTDVTSFLLDLNRLIQANSNENQFVTLVALLIDMSINECVLGNAGHTPALIRKANGELIVMKPRGDALGMWPNDDDTVYETIRFPFERGMKICLYSDGINEAKNGADENFGDERLRKLFKECDLPPRKTIDMILDKVKEFSGDTPQSDDQTMIVISRNLSEDKE